MEWIGKMCSKCCILVCIFTYFLLECIPVAASPFSLLNRTVTTAVNLSIINVSPGKVTHPPLGPKDHTTPDDVVSCYCNLPECVPSGYMCRSGAGFCFVKTRLGNSSASPRGSRRTSAFYRVAPSRGCLEFLQRHEREICRRRTASAGSSTSNKILVAARSGGNPAVEEVLECCREDVCNFEEATKEARVEKEYVGERVSSNTESLAWFTAATIVSPIIACVIFGLLIALSRKILRFNGAHRYQDVRDQSLKSSLCSNDTPEEDPNGPSRIFPESLRKVLLEKPFLPRYKSPLKETMQQQHQPAPIHQLLRCSPVRGGCGATESAFTSVSTLSGKVDEVEPLNRSDGLVSLSFPI